MMQVSSHEQQAIDFATKHGVTLKIANSDYKKHFLDDRTERWVFWCRVSRNKKSFLIDFGQSIANADKEPTLYDILSTVQKSDPGTYEEFKSEFGYDEEKFGKKKLTRLYNQVVREWKAIDRVFGDIINELQEIG